MLLHNENQCGLGWTGGLTLAWSRVTDLCSVMHTPLGHKASERTEGGWPHQPWYHAPHGLAQLHHRLSMARSHQDQQKVLPVKHRSVCCLWEAVLLSHFPSWSVAVIPEIALESQGVTWPLRAGKQTPESLHCVQHKVDKSAQLSSSQSLAGLGLNPRVFLRSVTLLICYIFLEESWERGAWVAHPSKNWVKSSGTRKKHFLESVIPTHQQWEPSPNQKLYAPTRAMRQSFTEGSTLYLYGGVSTGCVLTELFL